MQAQGDEEPDVIVGQRVFGCEFIQRMGILRPSFSDSSCSAASLQLLCWLYHTTQPLERLTRLASLGQYHTALNKAANVYGIASNTWSPHRTYSSWTGQV